MKLQNRLCIPVIVLCLLLASACDRRTPSNVLSKKEMTEVLVDYHLARAMSANLSNEQRYKSPLLTEGVFKKHKITKAIFDSSMVWYTRNPQELGIIYNRVNSMLQEKVGTKNLTQEYGATSQSISFSDPYPAGDSINMWRGAKLIQMNRFRSSRREQFVINTDSAFYPKDIIEWSLRANLLPKQKEGGKALMLLMVRYYPDSVVTSSRVISESGHYSLTVRNLSGRKMSQIWGFVQYFPGEEPADTKHRILIDRIKLMRYHKGSTTTETKSETPALPDSSNVDELIQTRIESKTPPIPKSAEEIDSIKLEEKKSRRGLGHSSQELNETDKIEKRIKNATLQPAP